MSSSDERFCVAYCDLDKTWLPDIQEGARVAVNLRFLTRAGWGQDWARRVHVVRRLQRDPNTGDTLIGFASKVLSWGGRQTVAADCMWVGSNGRLSPHTGHIFPRRCNQTGRDSAVFQVPILGWRDASGLMYRLLCPYCGREMEYGASDPSSGTTRFECNNYGSATGCGYSYSVQTRPVRNAFPVPDWVRPIVGTQPTTSRPPTLRTPNTSPNHLGGATVPPPPPPGFVMVPGGVGKHSRRPRRPIGGSLPSGSLPADYPPSSGLEEESACPKCDEGLMFWNGSALQCDDCHYVAGVS